MILPVFNRRGPTTCTAVAAIGSYTFNGINKLCLFYCSKHFQLEEHWLVNPEVVDSKGKGKMRNFPGEGKTLSGASSPSLKGKEKALPKPVIKLRKSKPSGQRLGSSSSSRQDSKINIFY